MHVAYFLWPLKHEATAVGRGVPKTSKLFHRACQNLTGYSGGGRTMDLLSADQLRPWATKPNWTDLVLKSSQLGQFSSGLSWQWTCLFMQHCRQLRHQRYEADSTRSSLEKKARQPNDRSVYRDTGRDELRLLAWLTPAALNAQQQRKPLSRTGVSSATRHCEFAGWRCKRPINTMRRIAKFHVTRQAKRLHARARIFVYPVRLDCPLQGIVLKRSPFPLTINTSPPGGYIRNHTRDLYRNFWACCLWPWLGPPPASLRYVMNLCISGFVDDVMLYWRSSAYLKSLCMRRWVSNIDEMNWSIAIHDWFVWNGLQQSIVNRALSPLLSASRASVRRRLVLDVCNICCRKLDN